MLVSGHYFCLVIPGVNMANDSHARVVGQHSGEFLRGKCSAIGNRHLAGVNRSTDAHAASVMN